MERLQAWIEQEMEVRRITSLDAVAVDSGVSQPTLSRIMRGTLSHGREYHPSRETCRALAVWLHKSEAEVIEAAGLFGDLRDAPQGDPEADAIQQRVMDLIDRLPEQQQELAVALLESLVRTDIGSARTETETEPEAMREAAGGQCG